MRLFIALAFVVGSLVPVASRADSPTSPTLAEIRTQQLEYRSQAERKTGPFKEMPSHEVSELLRKQGRVLTLTEGKQSLDELAPDAKVEVINSLEWIKASIAKVDNDRLICERVKVVGTNRSERVCRTVAEKNAERADAHKAMYDRVTCGEACRSN